MTDWLTIGYSMNHEYGQHQMGANVAQAGG
jgi:hypothetical protein